MTDVQQTRIERAKRAFYAEFWMQSDAGQVDSREQHEKLDAAMRAALAAADSVVTVEAIIGVLDHEGAQCGNCGREPGDPADCTDCARVLARYAAAIQRLYRGEAGA